MTSTLEPGPDRSGDDREATADVMAAVMSEVRPRSLRPTAREMAMGRVLGDDYAHIKHVREEPRKSVRQHITELLTQMDPRTIEGPVTPLIVFALIYVVGAWDDIAIVIIYPELRSEFTFNNALFVGFGVITQVIGAATGPFLGSVADRVKRVWLVRTGSLMVNLSSLIVATAGSFGMFLASRGLLVCGSMIVGPAQAPLIADLYPTRSRVRMYLFLAAAGGLGGFCGPLIVGFIAGHASWRFTVLVFAVAALAATIGTFFLKEPPRGYWEMIEAGASEEQAEQGTDRPPVSISEAFRTGWGIKTLRRLWLASLFTPAVLYGNFYIYIYLAGEGYGPQQRSYVLAAGSFLTFLALPFGGVVGDRLVVVNPGRIMALFGGVYFLLAASFVGIGLSPSPLLSIALLLPGTAAMGFTGPMAQAVSSMITPPNMRGTLLQIGPLFSLPGALGGLALVYVGPLLLGPFAASPLQASIMAVGAPSVIAAFLVTSASTTIRRDIRAAKAFALASEEADVAKLRGRNKMLICRDVDVSYDGVQVLFGVDFDVEEGELVALLGTNGAGKSTLMRAICGLQRASNGAIFLDGRDITQEPAYLNAGRGIVMVPGGHAIFPTLTVAENLRTAAWMHQADAHYVAERTHEVLELFPILRTRLHESAGNMSGGEQQMLAIGQALLMKPRLLMIDELSLGLAPAIVETLLATLRRIHADGTTVILIEQSLNVAITIAQRAVFMEKGEIRFDGPTTELMRRPELIRAVFMGGAATGGGALSRTAPMKPRGAARERLLSVEGVTVSFGGVRALNGTTIEVMDEEIVGIIGPNGAGKTTLFDVISGFVRPDEGAVLLSNVDVTRLGPEGRAKLGLGRSFQSARLFPSLTVRQNIAVAMERMVKVKNLLLTATWAPRVRQNERSIGRRVDGLIDMLGLGAYADKFVDELSTGTRRTVDIACIMASAPRMLLLDEPSSGLAQAETEALGPVLERLARDAGCGMLVIEHDIGLVSSISHRLYAMELGAVVTSGPPDEVVRDHRVVSSYLAATEDVVARSDLNVLMLDAEA